MLHRSPTITAITSAAWSDEGAVHSLMADTAASPSARAQAEDWLAERDLLGAGLRLRRGLEPCDEPGHAELRGLRIGIALRRLESWEARQVLGGTVEDPDVAVRTKLAAELGRHGDGMALDLLPRLARPTQPELVQRAVLVALRENVGRLPGERAASVLRVLGSGSVAREVPGLWVELARVHPAVREAASVACEAIAADGSRGGAVREAARDALAALDDLTVPVPEPRGLWGAFTGWLTKGQRR